MITSARIDLVPMTHAIAHAIVHAPHTLVAAPGFPTEGDVRIAKFALSREEKDGVFREATEAEPWGFWVVRARESGRFVGGIGLKGLPKDGAIEIGYGLAPSARGRGYAREAVLALCTASERAGVRVYAETDTGNVASECVLDACGFTRTRPTREGSRWDRQPKP